LKKDDDTFVAHKIKTFAPMNNEDYKWQGVSSNFELPKDFGITGGNKAVREMEVSQKNGFLIKLIDSADNGSIKDYKNTLFGMFTLEKERHGKKRPGTIELMGTLNESQPTTSTATIIDDILVEFRTIIAPSD
jgi:hypothetical protein